MQFPLSTYRLQFTPEYGFKRAGTILKYLQELGISHIYASPIFLARSGSTHGYDVCDHNLINPELGGEDEFERLLQTVRDHGLGWIQDIVPNHMAVSGKNPLLVDVLENGPDSLYFGFFDIDWDHPDIGFQGRMLAPFLGSFFAEALENGEIQLVYDQDGFAIQYYELRFPLRLESYATVLTHDLKELQSRLGKDHPDYIKLLGILYSIKSLIPGGNREERYDQIFFLKRLLFEMHESSEPIRSYMDAMLDRFNGKNDPADESRLDMLQSLLSEQYFRLSFWKVAGEEINYRRFFSINDLISLRMEDPAVFNQVHKLVLEKVKTGHFSGLRIDHIDGLYDPTQYLKRLRDNVGATPIYVEKILSEEEPLPVFWPCQGTTGYEFANMVCSLFVNNRNESDFSRIYQRFSGMKTDFPELVAEKKKLIIERHMSGDVDNLARLVKTASSRDRRGFDITLHGLQKAIRELLAVFPVYRTYISADVFRPQDRTYIKRAINSARKKNPDLTLELDFLERFLMLSISDQLSEEQKREWIHFVMRFQQFTGPLMAKGFEDTALYVMNRLLCLNEVGGWPDEFGITDAAWQGFNQSRLEKWPGTMNATASHDTKRGEDARIRLAALSEFPQEWEAALKRFSKLNARKKKRTGKISAPDKNDEYFLYQTLLASWPFADQELDSYPDRLQEYLIKAVREAKVHTGWIKPQLDYEQAYLSFAKKILHPGKDNQFLPEFLPLQQQVAHLGMLYSLGQVLLKGTAPGFPDFYQGTELWDLSFVDPDNRRPVDYELRASWLDTIRQSMHLDPAGLIRDLLKNPKDGRIKLFTTHCVLTARRRDTELFERGSFELLVSEGEHQDKVTGFVRTLDTRWAAMVCPRHAKELIKPGLFPLGTVWGDTRIRLPREQETCVEWFTGREFQGATLPLKDLFAQFPLALVMGKGE